MVQSLFTICKYFEHVRSVETEEDLIKNLLDLDIVLHKKAMEYFDKRKSIERTLKSNEEKHENGALQDKKEIDFLKNISEQILLYFVLNDYFKYLVDNVKKINANPTDRNRIVFLYQNLMMLNVAINEVKNFIFIF
jgi:hypothetical protein